MKQLLNFLIVSGAEFNKNDGFANAAAIAYYAAFSLPSILLVSIAVVGFFVDPDEVKTEIQMQFETVIGEDVADQVEQIVESADEPQKSKFATVAGGIMLLVGATGVLAQLQKSLNGVWDVESSAETQSWPAVVVKRILSLGMVLVVSFLLLVSVAVRVVIAEAGNRLDTVLPDFISSGTLVIVNQVVSFGVLMVLFAAMFRFLPDRRIPWKSVWFGALTTAVLFTIGKQLMAFYFSASNPGAVYGAAGSLAAILAWVYYASLIVLFGAQITQMWSKRDGATLDAKQ